MTDTDRLDAPTQTPLTEKELGAMRTWSRLDDSNDWCVTHADLRRWFITLDAAVRERDELRAALTEAYPTTSRELFHGHHPMCGWTIEADPKACNCVVALHREAGA